MEAGVVVFVLLAFLAPIALLVVLNLATFRPFRCDMPWVPEELAPAVAPAPSVQTIVPEPEVLREAA